MVNLSILGSNLVIESDEETLLGTQIFVDNSLKFTVVEDGLISNRLEGGDEEETPTAYVISRYGGHLILINRNALNEHYGSFFQDGEGLQPEEVLWFREDSITGDITPIMLDGETQKTGFYLTKTNGETIVFTDLYAKLMLKENGHFYVNAYIVDFE